MLTALSLQSLEQLKLKRLTVSSVGEDVEQLELSHTAGGKVRRRPLEKTVWQFFKRLNIHLPHDPAIPFLGIYPIKMKAQGLIHDFQSNFMCNNQKLETAEMFMNW